MRAFFSFALILSLSACSSTPDGKLTKKEQWEALASKEGAKSGSIEAPIGNTSKIVEFVFVQESDISFQMSHVEVETAKACENYARKIPAKEEWLESCQDALAEPNLSEKNRSITRFNKAMLLNNLNKRDEAKKYLKSLSQDDTHFGEADYELARLEYEDLNYSSAIKHAYSALGKRLDRKSRAYYIIGQSYESDFNCNSARHAYETGLQKNPGDAKIRRRLERLNRLWPKKYPPLQDIPS